MRRGGLWVAPYAHVPRTALRSSSFTSLRGPPTVLQSCVDRRARSGLTEMSADLRLGSSSGNYETGWRSAIVESSTTSMRPSHDLRNQPWNLAPDCGARSTSVSRPMGGPRSEVKEEDRATARSGGHERRGPPIGLPLQQVLRLHARDDDSGPNLRFCDTLLKERGRSEEFLMHDSHYRAHPCFVPEFHPRPSRSCRCARASSALS